MCGSHRRTPARSKQSLVVLCWLAAALLLFAQSLYAQKTDVVVMKNGDRLTCMIKTLESDVLRVILDYVDGTIEIDWSKVARVESDRLFLVKTESDRVYIGKISNVAGADDAPVKIEVAESTTDKVVIETKDVVKLGSTSDRFLERFNGDINFGLTYAKGAESTQYNLGSTLEYPRDRWTARLRFNSSFSSNSFIEKVTRNDLTFNLNRRLRRKDWFYSGTAGFLQSSEQGIESRTGFGGGIGRYLKNTGQTRIALTGGLGYERTKYSVTDTPGDTENELTATIVGDVRLVKFKKTNLDVNAVLFPSISNAGRIFFKLNASYYLKLYKNLNWNISFYGSWDTRAPFDLPSSDYGTSTGVGWTFGNR